MTRVLTLWPQVHLAQTDLPCDVCGQAVELRRQRVTSSQLDEARTWWLVSQRCVSCGSYSEAVREWGEP